MVTYKELQKKLKENINDKNKDELYSLTESLFAEFFKAYVDNDLDLIKEIDDTIVDFKENLKAKYGNVDSVVKGVELHKLKELYVLKDYQHDMIHRKDRILIYHLLIHEISSKFDYLKKLLCFYFLNAIRKVSVGDLDSVIADIKDDIIDLSDVAELYYSDSSADDVNENIEVYKGIIHDVFTNDYMEFLKENGMVEIQMELIKLNKMDYQCNKEYKELKLEIDDLFSENNGFKKIRESFIKMIKNETDVEADGDTLLDYLPEYDITTATYIPPVFPDIAEN